MATNPFGSGIPLPNKNIYKTQILLILFRLKTLQKEVTYPNTYYIKSSGQITKKSHYFMPRYFINTGLAKSF